MRLVNWRGHGGTSGLGILEAENILRPVPGTLSDVLHAADPDGTAQALAAQAGPPRHFPDEVMLTAPVEAQEVWAAGVTYWRSKEAREAESESAGASNFYDRVYTAPRPELFFKATAARVVGPGGDVRARADSRWTVPEPELALVISPAGRVVGYTLGNDVSARDIEGENPLYLPQAKLYKQSCALGPCITLASAMPDLTEVEITMTIRRGADLAFQGGTSFARFKRTPEELVEWLFRENEFPWGAILLTGTGVVPPDDFTLQAGDEVAISATGIGTLRNRVVMG